MVVQIFIIILTTISIVASGLLLANAEKSGALTPTPQPTPVETKAADGKKAPADKQKTIPTGSPTPQPTQREKLKKSDRETKETKPLLPVLMELSTTRDTFRPNQDMFVKAELWAIQPVTICLYQGHPEANFSVDIYRAGYGKLPTPPSVVQLDFRDMQRVKRIQLDPGQMHRVEFNLKKLVSLPPSFWKTGEYRVQAKFFLCGQTEKSELAIPSQGPLHLLVLE